jgi:hypothetical protein
MSFLATLHIEGHPKYQEGLKVSSFNFSFSQTISQTGQPQSRVNGGVITLSIQNLNDYDIFTWMFSQNGQKKGKIVLSSGTADGQSFQVVKFTDAALVNYNQSFSESAEVMTTLTISCKELDISGASFFNIWSSQ